jgi:uncharacterized membrane protein YgcG
MKRLHAIAISILLAAGAVAGATAALRTVHLGAATATGGPASVPEKVLAARRAKLAAWSASLRQADAVRPPALPKMPAFAPVAVPAVVAQQVATRVEAGSKVRRVVKRRVVELPPKHIVTAAPAATEQVTYVQPPPVVQYQQAPPAAAAATAPPSSSGEGDDSAGHGDSGGGSGGSSSGDGGGHGGDGGGD